MVGLPDRTNSNSYVPIPEGWPRRATIQPRDGACTQQRFGQFKREMRRLTFDMRGD